MWRIIRHILVGEPTSPRWNILLNLPNPGGFNKHRRPTKHVGYFAQRSQLLFSPKEAVTSAYNVVNKILDFQRLAPLLHIMKAQIIIIINNAQIKLASYGLFSVSKDM